jgi:hypothetical protein
VHQQQNLVYREKSDLFLRSKRSRSDFSVRDLFDFGSEYKAVVPKGFVRVLGN